MRITVPSGGCAAGGSSSQVFFSLPYRIDSSTCSADGPAEGPADGSLADPPPGPRVLLAPRRQRRRHHPCDDETLGMHSRRT
ncbi:MAG TPA: hypothetical protein VF516_11170 [Kofleriaceae bacterium]